MCNTTDKTKEFFIFSYFGILPEEILKKKKEYEEFEGCYKKYVAYKCAYRAYRDVCRTIHYSYTSEDIKAKNEGWEDFENLKKDFIKYEINHILTGIESLLNTDASFDDWHKELCKAMLVNNDNFKKKLNSHTKIEQLFKLDKKGKDTNSFKYGMAQKWLNMTIKNLLLAEDMFEGCTGYESLCHKRELFHVPVDKNILKAAKSDFNITGYSESWSSWGDTTYAKFIEALGTQLTELNPKKSMLDWEHYAWMENAE